MIVPSKDEANDPMIQAKAQASQAASDRCVSRMSKAGHRVSHSDLEPESVPLFRRVLRGSEEVKQ